MSYHCTRAQKERTALENSPGSCSQGEYPGTCLIRDILGMDIC